MTDDKVAEQIIATINRIHAAKGALRHSTRAGVYDLGQAFCSYVYGEGWTQDARFIRDSSADYLPTSLLPILVKFETAALAGKIRWLIFKPHVAEATANAKLHNN